MSSEEERKAAARLQAVAKPRAVPSDGEDADVIPLSSTLVDAAGPSSGRRYDIRETDDKRWLRCLEAPGVLVSVDAKHSYSEADARKLGERVILLDGAGQFAPLLDNEQQLYNLDHHRDCVRAFTLATCEQALVLVLKGLELDRADWKIYANEPDLDTVLAIWVLLNHRRVLDLPEHARDVLLPMLRLEGAIDSNGAEIARYCGLRHAVLDDTQRLLDELFEREKKARAAAGDEFDPVSFTQTMLEELDRRVFTDEDLIDVEGVEEEFGHFEVSGDRVAVVCHDPSGIYEVEKRLKRLWGDRLGLIALENKPGVYTIRRTSSLARIDLEVAWARLNLLDGAVDGRPPEKRWGGADDIGGSPRPGGSRLKPREVLDVLRDAYAPAARGAALVRSAVVVVASLLALAACGLAGRWLAPTLEDWLPLSGAGARLAGLGIVLAGLSAALTPWLSGGRIWLFGWRRGAGRAWLALAPITLLGTLASSAWLPPLGVALDISAEAGPAPTLPLAPLAGALFAGLCAVFGTELWFRGVAHGLLILHGRPQGPGSPRWLPSIASVVSGLMWAGITLALAGDWIAHSPLPLPTAALPWATIAGACIAGITLGVIRERTLSLWPGVGLQGLALCVALGSTVALG